MRHANRALLCFGTSYNMLISLHTCIVILGFSEVTHQISSKVDFVEDESTAVVKSSENDEDVEVKHTIVLSTKLKNNNRRGLHADDGTAVTYKSGNKNSNDENSDDVPIVKAFKSVETTQIRTPDTRIKPTTYYPDYIPRSRNSRDEYDLYPNMETPISSFGEWKPSSFFNNINWWNQDSANFASHGQRRSDYQKFHRRISDDGVREFYCRKCREMNGIRDCIQAKSNSWLHESTTPKIKIDGKLIKLN